MTTTGIILAAGRGSRMKELTEEKPKCFLKIKSKRLIDMQIEAFKKNNINDILILTGYKSYLFDEFNDCIKINNDEWEKTNMFFTLSKATKFLELTECIVTYSDIFYAPSAIKILLEDKSNLAITYDPNWKALWSKRFVDPLDDAETFKIDGNSLLTEIGLKSQNINEICGQYMGLIKFNPRGWIELLRVWKSLGNKKDSISITELFNIAISKNIKIKARVYDDEWGEIDSINDYKLYS